MEKEREEKPKEKKKKKITKTKIAVRIINVVLWAYIILLIFGTFHKYDLEPFVTFLSEDFTSIRRAVYLGTVFLLILLGILTVGTFRTFWRILLFLFYPIAILFWMAKYILKTIFNVIDLHRWIWKKTTSIPFLLFSLVLISLCYFSILSAGNIGLLIFTLVILGIFTYVPLIFMFRWTSDPLRSFA